MSVLIINTAQRNPVKLKKLLLSVSLLAFAMTLSAQNNIVEEVAWTIGDNPIYKSEIEQLYQDLLQDRTPIKGDPYCVIPEMIAVQRLYLHQADLDTVEINSAQLQAQVDGQMNFLVNQLGSREKVEEYFRKSYNDIRERHQQSTACQNGAGKLDEECQSDTVRCTPLFQ